MPDLTPTVGELFKAKSVTDDQVNAAANAYFADDSIRAFEIAPRLTVNLSEAIEGHGSSGKALECRHGSSW